MKSLCLTILLVCITFACPQNNYPGQMNSNKFEQDFNNDWDFASNSRRNNYEPGINRINVDQMGNRGGIMNEQNFRTFPSHQFPSQKFPSQQFPSYQFPSMHQIEDRSYDLAYTLGQGYGKKLGSGIKSGIGQSIFSGFNKGQDSSTSSTNDGSTFVTTNVQKQDP